MGIGDWWVSMGEGDEQAEEHGGEIHLGGFVSMRVEGGGMSYSSRKLTMKRCCD